MSNSKKIVTNIIVIITTPGLGFRFMFIYIYMRTIYVL